MTTSFYNGVGGMKSSQVGIDVWSHNISNVNTIGYKTQNVDFSSLFSNTLINNLTSPVTSDVGVSANLATTTMDLKQGSIQKTDNVFDLALEGKGWMKVKDSGGYDFFTRTGAFSRDSNGTLVSQNGDKLQVVNANNLSFDGKNWKFNSSISTDNLITAGAKTTQIDLPDNIIFPAKATENVKIGGNLPNENIASDPKPAKSNSDFGVLYDTNAQNMNIKNGQNLVFGFGDNIRYSEGLVRYDICIADDEVDGNEINIDFDINGQNIKLTLPDGSKAKTITEAIAKVLDDKNISYDKTDNSIQIKDSKKLYIKSNGGDIVNSNSSMEKLVYKTDDNTGTNFTTMQDFIDDLQNSATFTYGSNATVGIKDNGKLFIQNNSDSKELVASSFATDNSNDMFMQNLNTLGSIIKPNTSSNSLEFNQNYQGFLGSIIDRDGNKNDLKFDFYKTKVDGDNTIWNLTVSEIDSEGKVISTTNKDLIFDKIGGLLTPTKIEIDNNGTSTTIDLGGNFTGITSIDKENVRFLYSQDGLKEGYLVNYDVNDNGQIIANFSNSKNGVLAQIPIYHFQNEQGLDSIGQNKYTKTSNSGEELLYQTDDNYIIGAKIENYGLEVSNVNLSQAMTEVIITQKAFEANSKSITTSDQMIKKAIDMKR